MSERIVEGVRLSNPDKVLYPEQGITKGDLADYYVAVADGCCPTSPCGRSPWCAARPGGSRSASTSATPAPACRARSRGDDPGLRQSLSLHPRPAGLIALVQMGVLEIHPWGVRVERPDRPDRIIFDLDPAEGSASTRWSPRARGARPAGRARSRQLRQDHRRQGPARRAADRAAAEWREVKSLAKAFSAEMAADAPDLYLTRISKAERVGRIFIDYLRNDPTSTASGPIRPGAAGRAGGDAARLGRTDPRATGSRGFSIRTATPRIRSPVPGRSVEPRPIRGQRCWPRFASCRLNAVLLFGCSNRHLRRA